MRISFLHTADVHVATFDQIFADLGSEAQLMHRVEPELLARARLHGLESVRADTMEALAELASADAVVWTCSTLGPLADSFAEKSDHVFRIRPTGRRHLKATLSATLRAFRSPISIREAVGRNAWRRHRQQRSDVSRAEAKPARSISSGASDTWSADHV